MRKKMAMFAIALCVCSTIFATTAKAEKKNFNFSVTANANEGKSSPTGVNIKDDNEEYAHIHATNHNLIAADKFYYKLLAVDSSGKWVKASNRKRVTLDNVSHTKVKYLSGYAWKGAKRYFRGDTDYLPVKASGYWYA